jgi:hypothetical protein
MSRHKLRSELDAATLERIDELVSRPLGRVRPEVAMALRLTIKEALTLAAMGYAPMPVHRPHDEAGVCTYLATYRRLVRTGEMPDPIEIAVMRKSMAKLPLGLRWQLRATQDLDATYENFRTYPYAKRRHGKKTGAEGVKEIDFETNICLVTGAAHGYFLFDIDGREAEAAYIAMCEAHGAPGRTVEDISGGGEAHRHLWFLLPPGVELHPTAATFGTHGLTGAPKTKIDVKSFHSQGVIAPSLHHSGGSYRWINSPQDTPLSLAPEWIIREALACSKITNPGAGRSDAGRGDAGRAPDDDAQDDDDPFSRTARAVYRQAGGAASVGWLNYLATIGDGDGDGQSRGGFHGPIWNTCCSYFGTFGPDKSEVVLLHELKKAIDAAPCIDGRADTYADDDLLAKEISNAREFISNRNERN